MKILEKFITPIGSKKMHDLVSYILYKNTNIDNLLIKKYIESLSFDESLCFYEFLLFPLSDEIVYQPAIDIVSDFINKNKKPNDIQYIIESHIRNEFNKFKLKLLYKDGLLISNDKLSFLNNNGNFLYTYENRNTNKLEYAYEINPSFSINDLIMMFILSKTLIKYWDDIHCEKQNKIIELIKNAIS